MWILDAHIVLCACGSSYIHRRRTHLTEIPVATALWNFALSNKNGVLYIYPLRYSASRAWTVCGYCPSSVRVVCFGSVVVVAGCHCIWRELCDGAVYYIHSRRVCRVNLPHIDLRRVAATTCRPRAVLAARLPERLCIGFVYIYKTRSTRNTTHTQRTDTGKVREERGARAYSWLTVLWSSRARICRIFNPTNVSATIEYLQTNWLFFLFVFVFSL